jgi:hypothetical protein
MRRPSCLASQKASLLHGKAAKAGSTAPPPPGRRRVARSIYPQPSLKPLPLTSALSPGHCIAGAARTARRELRSLYDEAASLAYGATRLPACYAALQRVLSEVAARRPGWRPATVLDFGAGPATATWAAQQVRLAMGQRPVPVLGTLGCAFGSLRGGYPR